MPTSLSNIYIIKSNLNLTQIICGAHVVAMCVQESILPSSNSKWAQIITTSSNQKKTIYIENLLVGENYTCDIKV